MAFAQQQIVIGGEQVPVVLMEGANVFDQIDGGDMNGWMAAVGVDDEQYRADTVQALAENGYLVARAWADPRRSELVEVGVGPGWISGLVERVQRELVALYGVDFVRLMAGGEVQTDQEVAATILRQKNIPVLPEVGAESGFVPTPVQWDRWLPQLVSWVRPTDSLLADALQQIREDYGVDRAQLVVPYGNASH